MPDMKEDSIVVNNEADHHNVYLEAEEKDDNVDPSVPVRYRGTAADKRDMKVLGKTQVLRVRASAIPSLKIISNVSLSEISNLLPCWASLRR